MRLFGLLVGMCLAAFVSAGAQDIVKSLEQDVPGQGKVRIYQDPRIAELIGMDSASVARQDEGKVIKAAGYRIQVYAGNNTRQAKNEAYAAASRVTAYFPELETYTFFNPPRWLCRVGDFRSIEEADAMMRKMRDTGEFKEVSIVKEQINIYF